MIEPGSGRLLSVGISGRHAISGVFLNRWSARMSPSNLVAVKSWHRDIGDDAIGKKVLSGLKSIGPAVSSLDIIPPCAEQPREHIRRVVVVIDDENAERLSSVSVQWWCLISQGVAGPPAFGRRESHVRLFAAIDVPQHAHRARIGVPACRKKAVLTCASPWSARRGGLGHLLFGIRIQGFLQ